MWFNRELFDKTTCSMVNTGMSTMIRIYHRLALWYHSPMIYTNLNRSACGATPASCTACTSLWASWVDLPSLYYSQPVHIY